MSRVAVEESDLMGFPHHRCRQPEVMDQPDLHPERHRHALSGLARLNRLSLTARTCHRPLHDLQTALNRDRLRILDVACGGGDVAVALWERAARAGLDWRIAGCDVSPLAVETARTNARRAAADVHFFVHDVLARPVPTAYDAVICSLFLHHLEERQAVELFRSLAELGTRLILVNDLDRSRTGFLLAYLASRLFTRSPVVHTDALRSVRAAFRPAEAVALAERGGLYGATIRRCWPCRWLLAWRRS
ncbi:MAG: methyltransferase domain-containing protein [Gemmataceae bacterium]